METMNAVERWVLRQAAEDQVEVWSVLSRLDFEPEPVPTGVERRTRVLAALGTLLKRGLIKPLAFANGRYAELSRPWEQVLESLEREWDQLGREPSGGELYVFVATGKGVRQANAANSSD
ncbi:MAG TPA: hypothetical protein VE153_35330 [Myxococcus sp.]|nr:hypothetical protein [Myxococcus sp.]